MRSVTFGPYRLELETGELFRSDALVKLQHQPAKLLVMLVERTGELVTRDEIRRNMWGTETFVDFDQSVNFCVRQIRAALHDSADKPCYVETLPRRGYRFIAPVQPVTQPVPNLSAPETPANVASREGRWHRLAIASLALLVAAASGADVAFRQPAGSASVNQKTLQEVEIGRFFLAKVSREDTFKAIEHFEAAVREDANYAPAHAGLADSYNQLATVFVAGKPPGNVRLLAKRAATRAIQLDPNLADPYAALGNAAMHELDWAQAEQSYLRAIQLNPRYAVAHQLYGSLLVAQGRFSEAIAQARVAVELSPVSLRAREHFAWMLYFNREYESAIRELHAIVEMDRTFARAHWRLGQVLLVQGKYDEAIGFLQTAVDLSNRAPAAVGLLAMAYGGRGQIDAAERIVNELAERAIKETVPPGASLLAYLGVRNTSAALEVLERVYEEGDGYAMFVDADPLMDPLRNEPGFQAICRRIMAGSASHAALVRQ